MFQSIYVVVFILEANIFLDQYFFWISVVSLTSVCKPLCPLFNSKQVLIVWWLLITKKTWHPQNPRTLFFFLILTWSIKKTLYLNEENAFCTLNILSLLDQWFCCLVCLILLFSVCMILLLSVCMILLFSVCMILLFSVYDFVV